MAACLWRFFSQEWMTWNGAIPSRRNPHCGHDKQLTNDIAAAKKNIIAVGIKTMTSIREFQAHEAETRAADLAELLIDAVDSGASIGFMPPLSVADALLYWQSVIEAMNARSRVLFIAEEDGLIQGAVQLGLEMRANGKHRAEAMKLFVHRRARRQGVARASMTEAETAARRIGRTLLVMDTRQGGEAEKLCDSLGYLRYGEVPGYARRGNGELHTTVFFFRQL